MAQGHDYSHLTGKGGLETNLSMLRAQNNALQQQVQRLNSEMASRALPTLANFTDAVMLNISAAEQGNPMALEQLRLLLVAIKNAGELLDRKGKITIPTLVRK